MLFHVIVMAVVAKRFCSPETLGCKLKRDVTFLPQC